MDLENIKLKPCPFCAGKAKIRLVNKHVQLCEDVCDAKSVYIECVECNASTENFESSIDKNALEQAVSAWNQRKEDSIIPDEVVSEVENTFRTAGDQLLQRLNELRRKVEAGEFKEVIRTKEDNNEKTVHIPADSDSA